MHKTFSPKRISRKKLKRAMVPLRSLGIYYQGRRAFFSRQIKLIRNYLTDPESDEKVRVPIRRFLKRVGMSPTTALVARYDCDVIGTVYTPCANKACAFWGDLVSHLNCASYYMRSQGRNTLTVAEMGIFSGYSRSRINDILTSGMVKLRRSALKAMGAELFGAETQTEFQPGRCCRCDQETSIPPGYFGTREDHEPFQYCSFSCWTQKYPLEAFIEKNTGGNPTEVLAHLPRVYHSLEEAAKCLTASPRKLELLIWARQPDNSLVRDKDHPILSSRDHGRKFWEKQAERLQQLAKTPAPSTT